VPVEGHQDSTHDCEDRSPLCAVEARCAGTPVSVWVVACIADVERPEEESYHSHSASIGRDGLGNLGRISLEYRSIEGLVRKYSYLYLVSRRSHLPAGIQRL